MAGEKTEAPTPRRRQDARKKGQVAKSMEVNTALILLAAFWVMSSTGPRSVAAYTGLVRRTFSNLAMQDFTIEALRSGGMAVGATVIKMIAPLVITVVLVGVVANVGQVGLLLSSEALKPDLNRINPLNGLKRMFSLLGVVDLIKSLLKITIIGMVVYGVLRDNAATIALSSQVNLTAALSGFAQIAKTLGMRVATVMLVMAAADFLYQRYENEKSMRMSKQEIKEEMKRFENPQLKSRIRARQRQMAMNRMMAAIPAADVVITNPTHFAVALNYKKSDMFAPLVVAKGRRLVAQRIKEKAREYNVPMVENRPLARTLFKQVEIGQTIPAEMYKAVAEVLAFVYRLKSKRNTSW